jgi:hemerythrin-like domain-containing protein/rubredoxin
MLPVGPLMAEHRLIERMIALLDQEARRIRETLKVDTDLVLAGIQFIQLYADRCHHGKEEDILFRELRRKTLAPEHQRILAELEAEHVQARRNVARLVATRERVLKGAASAVGEVAYLLEDLARFYPRHIEKEDQGFFLPCMDYFSGAEQEAMLAEGLEFDRNLLTVYYEGLLDAREGRPAGPGTGPVAGDAPAGTLHTCMVCGYTYDPRRGDPDRKVPPGTPFDQLPEGWVCPHCHVGKAMFLPRR